MTGKGYTAEGGTSGSTVTTSDTGSGDAFSVATAGTGGTLVYDTTHAAHGTKAIKYQSGATSTSVYTAWTGLSMATVKFRISVYITSVTVSSMIIRAAASAAQRFRVIVETDGKLHIRDQGNTQIAISTANVPLNAWFSVRGEVTAGTSAAWNIRYYTSIDSVTATQTFSGSTGNFLAGNFDEIRFGIGANTASVAAFWLDDHAIDDTTSPGVALITVTPSGLAVPVALGGPAVADGSLAVAPTGLAVPVALGGPAFADGSMTMAPSGLSVPVGLGALAVADGALSVAVTGIAVPVSLGGPALADGAMALTPTGLHVPVALGGPAAADSSMSVALVSVAAPVALGGPATADGALSVALDGLAVPVTLGDLSVEDQPEGVSIALDGLPVAVALGDAAASWGATATGDGIAVPIGLGALAVADRAMVAGWAGLGIPLSIGEAALAFHAAPTPRPATVPTSRPATDSTPRPATVATARPGSE